MELPRKPVLEYTFITISQACYRGHAPWALMHTTCLWGTQAQQLSFGIYDSMNWDLPARSAYSDEEVNAIYEGVKNGGSLFFITDEMPSPASVKTIAQKFGFNMINGFAFRKDRMPEVFSRSGGNLHESVITNASGAVIDSIRIWVGTGFIAPKEATIISSLGDQYDIYLPVKASDIYGTISKLRLKYPFRNLGLEFIDEIPGQVFSSLSPCIIASKHL